MYVIAQYYKGTNHLYYSEKLRIGKCIHMSLTASLDYAQKFNTKEEIQKRLIKKGFQPLSEEPIRADSFIMEITA